MKGKQSDPDHIDETAGYLIKKGSIITIITLISRPLGYIREAVQAYIFGATLLVDAFVIAYNFPELIQTLFLSGATSAFLVPICTRYIGDAKEYSRVYSTFINISIIITFLLSICLLVLSPFIVSIIAPGFTDKGKAVTEVLFVIMIPVIIFHAVLSVMKAFLNAKEHFAAPEASGIAWNLIFIMAACLLSKRFGIYSLAIGVTVGSIVQIIIQIPYLKRLNIDYSPLLMLRHPAVMEAKRLFTGALIATSIVPINSFVDRVIASYLGPGDIASLAYAFRVFILPFSLFAVPVYTVMFSKISRLYHEGDMKSIAASIDSSITIIFITLVPCSILLCSAGDIFIKLLYERGAFQARETFVTQRALFGYSLGLVFYGLSISLVRVFNAFHDMKTPAIIGVTALVINAILDWVLMFPFGNMGISLATSIVSLYNFSMLMVLLKKRMHYKTSKRTIRDIIRSMFAGIILLFSIIITRYAIGERLIITFVVTTLLTGGIYFIAFKKYYLMYLKDR